MKTNKIIGLLLLAALANQTVMLGAEDDQPNWDQLDQAPDPNIAALKQQAKMKRKIALEDNDLNELGNIDDALPMPILPPAPKPAAPKAAVSDMSDKKARMAALAKAEKSALATKGVKSGQVQQIKDHAQMDYANFNAMRETHQSLAIPATVKAELAALADAAWEAYAEEREQYAQMQRRHRAMKDMDANLAQAKSLLNKSEVSRDEIAQHVNELASRIGELATRAQNDPAVQAKLAQARDAIAALRAKLDAAVDRADSNKSKVLGKLGKSSKKTAKK